MTLSKTTTQLIVQCWCNGLTAEETVDYLKEKHKISVALQTVYNHRKSLTAQDMVDELLRQQNRDIALADRALKLKYRDRVLAKLMPLKLAVDSIVNQTNTNIDETDNSIIAFIREQNAKAKQKEQEAE
jgi:hypothetical protein